MKCLEQANPETESRLVVARRRDGGRWGVGADGYLASFWGDENVLGLDSNDDLELCEYTKTHWILCLKMVNFIGMGIISQY